MHRGNEFATVKILYLDHQWISYLPSVQNIYSMNRIHQMAWKLLKRNMQLTASEFIQAIVTHR